MTRKLAMVLLLVAALAPRPAAALETDELLALVAMPLAVATVSEVADVPVNELMNFVSLLNDANVPPTEFVEVVRYVPVALIDDTQPDFVEYVRTRQQSGLSGSTLVTIIEDRYREVYGLGEVDFDVAPQQQIAVFDDGNHTDFVPAIVRNHPHGGPPGQLKKARGLQTGAEVVHGVTRGRVDEAARQRDRVKQRGDRDDRDRARVTRKPSKVERQKERGGRDVKVDRRDARPEVKVQSRGNGGGKGRGHGNAQGPKGNGGGGKKGKG